MNSAGAICNFKCVSECAAKCCGGATMITIDEIVRLYDAFPITIGFRKYAPLDEGHEAFLEAIGTRLGKFYIVGDFIAGNWRKNRCSRLGSDNLCTLQKEGRKPYQCTIMPFCAIYPEEKQNIVFLSQHESAFRKCSGYAPGSETENVIWKDGRFVSAQYSEAFSRFRRGMLKQSGFMNNLLGELRKQTVFSRFLLGDGILETAIPTHMIVQLLNLAGLEKNLQDDFARRQRAFCLEELRYSDQRIAVFEDSIIAFKGLQNESS
ncbi:MAG TPA: hypothetical protein VK452_02680 [Dissulfurispiraceae bacterium]|nr:hypothetical protein [Dissulfurispiraceae bacterium]